MKKLILSIVLVASTLTFATAQTYNTVEASKWSLALKGGGDYFRVTPASVGLDNVTWGAGLILERTANPLFGMGLDVSYLNYIPGVTDGKGSTIDPTIFGSLNLSNLLFPHRESSRWNVYAKAGAGAAIYSNNHPSARNDGKGVSPLATASLHPEVRLSRVVSLGAEIGARYYVTEVLGGVASKDRFDDAMTAMLSLRFNLGSKGGHVRNLTLDNFYALNVDIPVQVDEYDDAPLTKRVDNLDRQLQGLQGRFKNLEDALNALKDKPEGASFTASFDRIEFGFDSANLTEVSKATLDQIASILLSNPHWSVLEVKGHTDNIGPDAYNQQLSERRADAVKNYLVSKGLSESALSSSGYGQTQPVASNNTAEGRKANRRVEFQISK